MTLRKIKKVKEFLTRSCIQNSFLQKSFFAEVVKARFNTRSTQRQGKFKVTARQGKAKVKVRSRQGQIRVKAM